MITKVLGGACLLVVPFAAASAQPADLANRIVNDPGRPQVTGAKASLRDDPKVQGGKAIRIEIAAKGKNVWDASIGSGVTKPVKAGDQLVLAFWARLEKGDKGAAATTLPYNAVQLASAPWSPLFNQSAEIGAEWTLIQVKGTADKDYAANALTATMHLATARQTIDFGPIVVLDLGQAQ
jgi:hypothetical protein